MKVDDLMKANAISDAKRIVVGQKLVIPAQQPAAAPAAEIAAPIVSAKQSPVSN
jgi:LysM repeat protein